MKTALGKLSVIALLCAGAHAATQTSTITITGTGVSSAGTITASGSLAFAGTLAGLGTFSSTFSLTNPVTLTGTIPISLNVTAGTSTGTLTGTLSAAPALLLQVFAGTPTASGPGTIAIASGTSMFAGATGSFTVTVAGTGAGTTGSGAGNFSITGPGSITTGGSTAPATPTVTFVQNNYSFILPGFPNYGIAPGALFVIKGTAMADPTAQAVLQSSAAPGIPLTLNGASLSVTVNGTTVHPGIYYATATQIAAVLPAATPIGTGTLTVTYNTTPSATFAIQVTAAALGIGTYNGLAIATNPVTGALYSYTKSAKPGDTIVLWGSGLGAIATDSDTVYTSTPHAAPGTLQVFIGGLPATVGYGGNSGYPGVNQINVTVPAAVLPGCNVSLVAVSGTGSNLIVSNTTALSVDPSGAVCTDAAFGTNGTTVTTLSGKSSINTGAIVLIHSVSPTQTNDIAEASFQQVSGASYISGSRASLGGCAVSQSLSSASAPAVTVLNAGTVSVTGPVANATLVSFSGGILLAQLATGFLPSTGGAFMFQGTAGANVGSFTTTVNFPNPLLAWSNQAADATVSRASGADVNWTGGATGSYVEIVGTSANTAAGISGSFYCFAPAAAGTFHVPNAILLGLPAGTGNMSVTNATNYQSFTATGLDSATSYGFSQSSINATFQ